MKSRWLLSSFTDEDITEKMMHKVQAERMDANILSLLPHSIKTQLTDQSKKLHVLKLCQFLITELHETVSLFETQKLYMFDPHVGDTLCQIRAYKILLLFCRGLPKIKFTPESIKHLIEFQIREFKNFIEEKKGKYSAELDKKEGIYEFFKRKDLIFEIPKDLIFLVQSKILSEFSKVDKEGISKGIDYDKFSIKASITKSLSKRIMHCYQQNIAKKSCDFLTDLIKDLPELNILREPFHYLQKIDRDGRLIMPCYEATKILIKHITKNKQPVLLVVERKSKNEFDLLNLLWIPDKINQHFHLIEAHSGFDKVACIIIKGVTVYNSLELMEKKTCFIERLTTLGVLNVIMANMACHPQYSAPELSHLNDDPYFYAFNFAEEKLPKALPENMKALRDEFFKMKKNGYLWGCCIENPSLFFIRHVFCNFASCYQLLREATI